MLRLRLIQRVSQFSNRTLATQAAAKTEPSSSGNVVIKPEISNLSNDVTVVTMDNRSLATSVGIIVNAGSRYETGETLGVTHTLRRAATLTTDDVSGFMLCKKIGQMGSSLRVTGGREHIIYEIPCTPNNIEEAVSYLTSIVCRPSFKPWEMTDNNYIIKEDLRQIQHNNRAMLVDLLHQAAYRRGLGNSLYTGAHKLSTHTPELLHSYVQQHYVGANISLVGVGINHELLEGCGASLASTVSTQQPPKKQTALYGGGDMRKDSPGPHSHVAIVTEGLPIGHKDSVALGLLHFILGPPPAVKWGSYEAGSLLMKAAKSVAVKPCAVSCYSEFYSDSGLFGFYAATDPADAPSVLRAALGQFGAITKGAISEADLHRAKNQLKATVVGMVDSVDGMMQEGLGNTVIMGEPWSLPDVFTAIDNTKMQDVVTLSKKIFNSKKTMAAVGDLRNTPYLDEVA